MLNTSSINVSEGGIFVDTDEYLLIGAPIVCNVPFGRDEEAMQLRGRVAWMRSKSSAGPNRPSGVGIEFVDLSDDQSEMLSEIVGGNEELCHQLSLKLQGLQSPVRGEAFLTPNGVLFRSKLPFLALDSHVEFAFEDEDDVYDGRIVGLEVVSDPASPIPRLQVEVRVDADEMPSPSDNSGDDPSVVDFEMMHVDSADTEKTEVPGIHSDEALVSEEMAAKEQASQDHSDEALASQEVIEIPQMLPIVVADEDYSGAVNDEIDVGYTERVVTNQSLFARRWPPVALLAGSILGILAFALAGGDDAAETPEAAQAGASDTASASGDLMAPGLLATSASPDGVEAQEAAARIRHTALSEQEEFGDLTGAAAIKTSPSTRDQAVARAQAPAAEESIGGVKIWESKDELVMRLPYKGNLERAASYPLADPPGLAINLPYAQPKAGYYASVSPAHEQIRTLWVRERLGGLHFRAFFEQDAESCKVSYAESAIIVRCRF